MSHDSHVDQESRRKFVKTVAYVTPAIVTLSAIPSFASAGSGYQRDGGSGYHRDGKSSYHDGQRSYGGHQHRSFRRSR